MTSRLPFRSLAVALLLALVLAAPAARASTEPSLGVFGGLILPDGKVSLKNVHWDPGYNWGFLVDLPLLKSFHLAPTAMMYRLGDVHAGDMNLSFRFVIPTRYLSIYLGIAPGVTALVEDLKVNLGGEVGFSARLIGNVAFFFQGRYKEIFGGSGIHVIHFDTGVMFYF